MRIKRLAAGMLTLGLVGLCADVACGQNYPAKPIRIVTSEAGGGAAFIARVIAQGLSAAFDQPVVVDNRGGGVVPVEIVAKAPADGYVLLAYGATVWLGPLLRDKASYDPIKDFAPITIAVSAPQVLAVHPSLPVRNVRELIAIAKSRPAELNYGSGNSGSSSHLAGELFKAMAGINIMRINYKGTGPAVNALISGEVQLMFPNAPSVASHVKSGRLKSLAVGSAQPSALAPGLPTVAASGLPGYEAVTNTGLFAPAKTPAAIVSRLNQEVLRVLAQPDVKEKLFNLGVETVGSNPEQLASMMKSEMARMGKVIKDAGIREE